MDLILTNLKLKPATICMSQSHHHLSDENNHDSSTTEMNFCILPQFILSKYFISSLLKTMWYHMNGYTNNYHCTSAIYLLSSLALYFFIITNRAISEPGNGNYVVDDMNTRYKHMLKLEMGNILNPELITN